MTEATSRRAKLELLVRCDHDDSFAIHEIGSALAFARYRPHRVPRECYELAELAFGVGPLQSFILKNTQTDQFLLVSERERFLWEQMNGYASLQDIATAYVLKYGQFDFQIIPNLLRKLQRARLITLRPMSRLRTALEHHRGSWIVDATQQVLTRLACMNVSTRGVQPCLQRLYSWGGLLLFTPAAAVAYIVLAVGGFAASVHLWRDAGHVLAGVGIHPFTAFALVKLTLLVTVGLHQLMHGLALVHYGRVVREFGFTFACGFIPSFYVDITDIFMTSRRARVVTALSGALVHLVLGSILFIVAAGCPEGFLRGFSAASAMVQWQAFVIALYPFCFLEMDGYHVLVDALGVPTLRHDALAYARIVLRGTAAWPLTREEGLWVAYLTLSAASVAGLIAFNVWLIVHAT